MLATNHNVHGVLLSLVALLWVGATRAQLELRPHIGINAQDITRSPDGTQWQGKAGFTIGAHVLFGSEFFFQPGVQYVESRVQLTRATTGLSPTATNTLQTTALLVPVVVGLWFSDPAKKPLFDFRMFGGIAGNFPLSSSFVDYGREDTQVGKTSLALKAGAGLDMGKFFLDLSWDAGITDVFNEQEFDLSAKSVLIQFNAGMRLKFAK